MSEGIRIGVLGCANIAKRYVIPAINELNNVYHLIGIASRNKKKALEYAAHFNTMPYIGYEILLRDASLDAVYIPLPNALHYHWIKEALNRGLHVLVEKSMACTHEEVVELNKLAEMSNLVLLENFQFRFHTQLSLIEKMLAEGVIGELRNIRSSFGFPPFSDSNNIRYQKALGGGALLDAGAYTIKISTIFMGDITVEAASLYQDPQKDVDIWGSAYLKQTRGKLASQIAFGFDHHYQCKLELWGSKGKITADRIFTAPPGFEASIELETPTGKEIITLPPDNHFVNMLHHFASLIRDERNRRAEYTQNKQQARLLQELRGKANEQ